MSETIEREDGSGRAQPAFRTVAAQLEAQILSGELPLGATLPGETTLATRYAVSRSTIREAIRLLEQIGIIRRAEGRNKLTITAPRAAEIGARLRTAFILQDTSFEQLWEVLTATEPLCAAVAAQKADAAVLKKLAENIAATEAAHEAETSLVELDIAFHNLLAEATGNAALQLSRETIGELFYPAFAQVMARLNAGERLLLAHRKIYDAVAGRNAGEARSWMERHIGDFQRGCDLANLDFKAPINAPIPAIR